VNQTIKFALRNKVPRDRPEQMGKHHFVQDMRDTILNSLGIGHTQKTLVGNEFIRGVSGGERKRVSLAEVMAAKVGIIHALNETSLTVILPESPAILGSAYKRPRLQDGARIHPDVA
jgi:ABC-type hemin transport system ATPase subunit